MATLDANLLALQTLPNVHISELVHCSIKNVLHNVTIPTRKKRNSLRLDYAEIKPVLLFNKLPWHIQQSKHVVTNSYK
jgi:hypothetical protein